MIYTFKLAGTWWSLSTFNGVKTGLQKQTIVRRCERCALQETVWCSLRIKRKSRTLRKVHSNNSGNEQKQYQVHLSWLQSLGILCHCIFRVCLHDRILSNVWCKRPSCLSNKSRMAKKKYRMMVVLLSISIYYTSFYLLRWKRFQTHCFWCWPTDYRRN